MTTATTTKKKKPAFTRQDSHKKPSLHSTSWRRPRGLQSKMRLQFKGYKPVVKSGYSNKRTVRHTTADGKILVLVTRAEQLKQLTKQHAIILSATLGAGKKLAIMDAAEKMGITISNINPALFRKRLEQQKADRTAQRQSIADRRKKKTSEEKKAKKEEAAPEQSEEEEKEQQKREKDKLLTKKDAEF